MVVPSRSSLRWLVPPILMSVGLHVEPAAEPAAGGSLRRPLAGPPLEPPRAIPRPMGVQSPALFGPGCGRACQLPGQRGKVFVIVDWRSVSTSEGPGAFQTAVFPCGSPIEGELTTRIEFAAAPTGDAEVAVFALDGAEPCRRHGLASRSRSATRSRARTTTGTEWIAVTVDGRGILSATSSGRAGRGSTHSSSRDSIAYRYDPGPGEVLSCRCRNESNEHRSKPRTRSTPDTVTRPCPRPPETPRTPVARRCCGA